MIRDLFVAWFWIFVVVLVCLLIGAYWKTVLGVVVVLIVVGLALSFLGDIADIAKAARKKLAEK